jgi:hypothetical protein
MMGITSNVFDINLAKMEVQPGPAHADPLAREPRRAMRSPR